eukprot:Skav202705  [mRNA]  locus=scaffold654:463220:465049:+ [translate_table: standard]
MISKLCVSEPMVKGVLGTYDLKLPPIDDDDWTGIANVLISDCELVLKDPASGTWTFRAYVKFGNYSTIEAYNWDSDVLGNRAWRYGPPVEITSCTDFRKGTKTAQTAALLNVKLETHDGSLHVHFGDASKCVWWDMNLPKSNRPLRVVDVFSGGMGGWIQALKWTNPNILGLDHVGALDNDHEMMRMYQQNHGGVIHFDPDTILAQADTTRPILLTHDLTLSAMVPLLQATEANAWCLSPPCPPWSPSGRADGFHSEPGQSFLHALGIAKLNRASVLFMENVATIQGHEHYEGLKKAIEACGFRLIWEQRVNIARVCPTKRFRWMAIAVDVFRFQDDSRYTPWFAWPHTPEVNLGNGDCLFMTIPADLRQEMKLTDHMMEVYGDARFALQLGVHPRANAGAVLEARTVGPADIAKTFMAAYGRQHDLPESMLAEQGLHTQILMLNDGTFRFFMPQEIAIIHGAFQSLVFPRDMKLAWHAVGNSISPIHGAIAFYMFAKIMGWTTMPTQDVVNLLRASKVAASVMQLRVEGEWILLEKTNRGNDMSPFHEGPAPTMPFVAQIQVTIFTNFGVCTALTDGTLNVFDVCISAGWPSCLMGSSSHTEDVMYKT